MASKVDDFLLSLMGSPHAALAGALLGMAIGAQTDLGRTDEQIIEMCEAILSKIRTALKEPEPILDALKVIRGD